MTGLKKAVTRKCVRLEHRGRALIVTLHEPDMITMREAGRRTRFSASLDKVFWALAKWDAVEKAKAKALARKARKAGLQ